MEKSDYTTTQYKITDSYTINDNDIQISFKESDDGYTVSMICQSNDPYGPVKGMIIPQDYKDDFSTVARAFSSQIITFFDPNSNTEFEVGYDMSNEISIFFEMIDYNYEADKAPLRREYSVKISPSDTNLVALVNLLDFLEKVKMKGENENGFESNHFKY